MRERKYHLKQLVQKLMRKLEGQTWNLRPSEVILLSGQEALTQLHHLLVQGRAILGSGVGVTRTQANCSKMSNLPK